jgi:opacity protein-like surface antigen
MKRVPIACVAAGVGLLIFVLGGGSASAEWFFDLYGGAAFPMDPDLTVTGEGGAHDTVRGHSDPVWTVGGRGGYWFDRGPRWLGVAVDISYFEPEFSPSGGTGNVAKLDIQTLTVTPLAMFRWPLLESPEHPNGRLQPYVGIGPGVFHQKGTVQFRSGAGDISEEGFKVGVDVRAGVAYEFLPNWALFVEYRFTHVSDSVEGHSNGQQTTVDFDVNTNAVLLGVGYRFR